MMRAHIFYSGMVQGVGFRYTVQRLAAELNLTGWVKNLPDGRVEIWAEGSKEILEDLQSRIEKRFDGYIKNKEIDYHPSSSRFKGFEIAF